MTREQLHTELFGFCYMVNHPNGFYIMPIIEMIENGFPQSEKLKEFEKEQKEFLEKYPNPVLYEPYGLTIN